ncbi:MAG: type III-A CRISPR-associated RAMP protein Csm3, partial [Aquificota bacterium]
SLLEWATGRVEYMLNKNSNNIENAGKPCDCGRCDICKVFGTGDAKTVDHIAKSSPDELPGPPRLRVYDAYLNHDSFLKLIELTEGLFTEIKTENQINRITSRANPRKVERVPAGAVFEGRMVFDIYKDEDVELLKLVFCGMRMLEDSYLGGYGSRGSGRVRFEDIKVIYRPKEYYLGRGQERELSKAQVLEKLNEEELVKNLKTLVGNSHAS